MTDIGLKIASGLTVLATLAACNSSDIAPSSSEAAAPDVALAPPPNPPLIPLPTAATPASAPSKAQVLSCDSQATTPARYGNLLNNMWNKQSAGSGDWWQCLQTRTTATGAKQLGWSWNWPKRDGLYAYPQIMVGHSPWRGEPSNDARFPRQISATKRLEIGYDVTLNSSGKQNLVTDLWITSTKLPPGAPPDPSIIKAEMMIWTHASPGLIDSSLKPVGEIVVNGIAWLVYVRKGWGDASGGAKNTWTLISYISKSEMLKTKFDAKAFLSDAVSRGLIKSEDYLSGVELGNEIISGTGSTWVNSFDVVTE